MKKLTTLSAILFSAVLILSCSKEAVRQPAGNINSLITTDPSPAVKAVSKWFSPVFNVVHDRSSIYLMAHQDHETNLSYVWRNVYEKTVAYERSRVGALSDPVGISHGVSEWQLARH